MVRRMLKLRLSIQPGEASQKWTQANQQIAQVKLADQARYENSGSQSIILRKSIVYMQ